jgi:RNA polymerase sigma factor (sigma-70 family)
MSSQQDDSGELSEGYWTAIYEAHRGAMYAESRKRMGLKKTHLGHDSESVVQDVMARLIARGKPITADNQEAYLRASVRNRAIDLLKQESRRVLDRLIEGESEQEWEDPSDVDIATVVADLVMVQKVDAALDEMDDSLRFAFVEHLRRGRSYADIARETKQSDVTIRNRFLKALEFLRREIGEGWER